MNTTYTLCLRFLAVPITIIGILLVVELGRPAPSGAFWAKVGLALAGIGLGSIIPYISSDEALYLKFATIAVRDDEQYVLTFSSEEKKTFDFIKAYVLLFFILGIVIWFANHFFAERFTQAQAPTLTHWFWLTGVIYCGLAGALFIYLSVGRKTNFGVHEGKY